MTTGFLITSSNPLITSPNRMSRRWRVLPLLLPGLLMACQAPQETATSVSSVSAVSTVSTSEAATSGAAADHSAHGAHSMASAAPASGAGVSGAATAESAQPLALEVRAAGVTAVPPSMHETAAYVTLHNPGEQDIVLVGASTPAAEHTMLMETVITDASGTSMSGMVEVQSLTVPAGGELAMASGGDHIMLMGLTQPLEEGQEMALTLQAQDGRTLELNAVVERP